MNEGSGGFWWVPSALTFIQENITESMVFFWILPVFKSDIFCRYPRWCQKFMHLATISCTFISTNDNELGKSTQCIPRSVSSIFMKYHEICINRNWTILLFSKYFLWFCTLVFNIAMQNYPFEQAIIFLKWAITIAAAMFSWTRRLWILKLPRSWRQGLPTSRRLHPPATSGEHLACSGSQNVRKVTKFSRNFTCAMVKQQMIAHVKRQYLVGINREIF